MKEFAIFIFNLFQAKKLSYNLTLKLTLNL